MLAADTDPSALAGLEVVDRRGERLGRVRQVYPGAGGLGWVAVRGNLLGTSEALVPLDGAVLEDDVLGVPVSRSRFLAAPRRPADHALGEAEQQSLHAFYAAPEGTPTLTAEVQAAVADAEVAPAASAGPPSGTVEMTAHDERLRITTERVPRTRVRLVKTVVTEQRTVSVTVRREEVHLVREPIPDAEPVTATAFVPTEQEVVLHEERVVVGTETVPVERVRLVVDEVAEDREVTADVRRERVELAGDAPA